MRNRTVLGSLIVLGAILVGIAIVVVALGTSTGIAVGGDERVIASAEGEQPVYAQGGWIKNNAPWPIQINSVSVDLVGASTAPTVYLSNEQSTTPPPEGEAPLWTAVPATFPYTIEPGMVKYFGFAVSPDPSRVASFDTMTITGQGLLGFGFEETHEGVVVAGSAGDLPFPMAADDPAETNDSFDTIFNLMLVVFDRDSVEQTQILMGRDSTVEEATALLLSQAAYVPEMPYQVTEETKDERVQTVTFYATDPEVDALPAIRFTWADYRWTLSLVEVPAG